MNGGSISLVASERRAAGDSSQFSKRSALRASYNHPLLFALNTTFISQLLICEIKTLRELRGMLTWNLFSNDYNYEHFCTALTRRPCLSL